MPNSEPSTPTFGPRKISRCASPARFVIAAPTNDQPVHHDEGVELRMIISEREAELAQAVEMGSELVERIKSLNETVWRLECELDSSKRETSEVD